MNFVDELLHRSIAGNVLRVERWLRGRNPSSQRTHHLLFVEWKVVTRRSVPQRQCFSYTCKPVWSELRAKVLLRRCYTQRKSWDEEDASDRFHYMKGDLGVLDCRASYPRCSLARLLYLTVFAWPYVNDGI
jgi:hypothetical protein